MATFENAITVTATGTNQTTGAASARIALSSIPTAAGTVPRYIRITAINESFVKVGDSTVAATNGDVMVQPADAVILRVQGCTHVAFIQGASAGRVNIVPLEDQ